MDLKIIMFQELAGSQRQELHVVSRMCDQGA